MGRTKPMPRKFTRVNEVEKNGQRSTVLYSVAGAVRVCGGPALRCSVSADVALSEKSPHLGGAWVRWSLQQEPGMQPDEPPSPILLLGRDRSPSGPALRCSMSPYVGPFREIAPSGKRPGEYSAKRSSAGLVLLAASSSDEGSVTIAALRSQPLPRLAVPVQSVAHWTRP